MEVEYDEDICSLCGEDTVAVSYPEGSIEYHCVADCQNGSAQDVDNT